MLKQSRKALTCLAKRYRAELRRCRLRALALALACALTALPPLPAGAANSGGTVDGNGDYVGSQTGSNGDVFIDSDVSGSVYGGETASGDATGNRVILSGAPTLTGIIYGGDAAADAVSGNLLEVRSSGLQAKNIKNFAEYAFQLPADIRPGGVLLTLAQATDLTNDGKSPSPDIQRIDVDGAASPLRVGDTVTLLKSNGLKAGTLPTSVSGTQGVTLAYTYALSNTNTTLDATVTDTRFNPQTKALSEGHVSGTALALQGADLAAGKGMEAAGRASLAGGGRGVAAFGALSGGWSRYNTGSHIDVSGFSLLTGLAWGADSVLGQFTVGAFFEYGSASTGTYNSFSNAASVSGDGSSWYMGAGLLARMDFNDCGSGHIYAEASGRAGGLHNEYRNDDLRDADGRRAEFDTSTPYISLHAGLGYIWNLTDALSLDLHAKYFWTWQDSADTDLSTGEALHFDAVNSHRLRLGGRLTYAVNEHISPYVGAAWEHEFDGTARATSLGYDLDAPSLKGDTGIGELGLSWTPSATTPLTIDLSVQGYTGVREGYTGSFMAKWEF